MGTLLIVFMMLMTACSAQPKNDDVASKTFTLGDRTYHGQVIAGNLSPYLDFNQTDYEAAIASDKLVVLYFYADWCPICRFEIPKLKDAFDELNTDQVIGFQVNYNDKYTEDSETELAREFGVAYQHTKVFLKNGERVLKSPESWSKKRYLNEINTFIK